MSDFLGAFLWGVVATCAVFLYLWLACFVGSWLYYCRKRHEREIWKETTERSGNS